MPEQKQYRLWGPNGLTNYIYNYGLTNTDPTYTKNYNAYYVFKSADRVNCPAVEYEIEKI